MLRRSQLLDIGTAPDVGTLQSHLEAVANDLDFGIASGSLIRGRLGSGKAQVHAFGNTPEAFIDAFRSADLGQRDPLLARMLARPGAISYDQQFYVGAGAGDLWDVQAPFGYRNGLAFAIHESSHAEVFCLGIDGPDGVPTDPTKRMLLEVDLQLVAMHAQEAIRRLCLPRPGLAPDLSRQELEALRWAADGVSVRMTGDLMVISDADAQRVTRSAMRKLGASNRSSAVLRAIDGGLIDR